MFDQVCSFGLEVSDFFIAICMLRFFIAICILRRAICVRCNIDCFLLNQKDLESMSILPKNFCNMHIARCNKHIAIESILPLTYRAVSRGRYPELIPILVTVLDLEEP